ncbi:MAG: hypothetical protein FVQ77_13595 [Cytophagales bacterium]|nr:hypothetical protein [Cytophagales bacterium]
MVRKKKKTNKSKKPDIHKELEGFQVAVNPFGEITSTMDIDKINKFLDKHVEDKKLKNKKHDQKKAKTD